MFRTIAAAVALFGATAASPLLANENVDTVQGRVSYAGLDLSSQSDLAHLKQRIERESQKICTRGLHKDLWGGPDVKACKASAIANGKGEAARLIGSLSVHDRVTLSDRRN